MRHLTHTGYDAGRPICGARRMEGDTGAHAAYAEAHHPYIAETCLECLKVMSETFGEEWSQVWDAVRAEPPSQLSLTDGNGGE